MEFSVIACDVLAMLIRALLLPMALFQYQENPSHYRQLIEKLGSDRVEEREEATQRLKNLGKQVIAELTQASKDSDAEIASRIKKIIRTIENKELCTSAVRQALPGIEDQLAEEDLHNWTQAFFDLTEERQARLRFPFLRREDIQRLAPHALSGARDSGERCKVLSLVTAGRLENAVPQVKLLLKDMDPSVRAHAALALARLDSKVAVSELLLLLTGSPAPDVSPEVRATAARELGELNAKNSIAVLLKLVDDADPRVFGAAVRALSRLGVVEAVPRIANRIEDPLRVADALEALVELNATETIPQIVKLLAKPQVVFRVTALNSLKSIDAKIAAPEVSKLLADEDSLVRSMALNTLGHLQVREYAQDVMNLFNDPVATVRRCALHAYGRLASDEDLRRIDKLLSDPKADVRAAALSALCARQASDMSKRLEICLSDEDDEVRLTAAVWLCRLGTKNGTAELLKQKKGIVLFNAVRDPKNWSRLTSLRSHKEYNGTTAEVLKAIAQEAGMTLALPEALSWKEEAWFLQSCRFRAHRFPSDPLSIIECILDELPAGVEPLEFILEPACIRLLKRDQASLFWKNWVEVSK
jgi:HEAT repeat protein